MTDTIFWYDYETTGIDPRCDRPFQVAGIRTDEFLNEIGDPVNEYCRLSDDILPHPVACMITGISPEILDEKGSIEAAFFTRLHKQLAVPGTCTAGYNTLRIDGEVTRYGFYRNFFDPYAREWRNGNSRWDIIDLLRACYALRPDGIEWPQHEGRVSLKLELLTRANGLDHDCAHDALSDVRATIALAKRVRSRQPRLYDYLYGLRRKQEVSRRVRLLEPVLHISGRFSADRFYAGVVLPLAPHPWNQNAFIVCDLQSDITPILNLTADEIKERLYTRHELLPEGLSHIPLKLIHINRCPVISPLNVLRDQDISRLGLDLENCFAKARLLKESWKEWEGKLKEIYSAEESVIEGDPEQQLYKGFFNDHDKRLCDLVQGANADTLNSKNWHFDDSRLPELLFRYRARNYPQTLSEPERVRWKAFCKTRLSDISSGAPNTLEMFFKFWKETYADANPEQRAVLDKWRDYAKRLEKNYFSG